MRQNSIIPRSYIQIRVAKSPAFYSYLGKEGNTVVISNFIFMNGLSEIVLT